MYCTVLASIFRYGQWAMSTSAVHFWDFCSLYICFIIYYIYNGYIFGAREEGLKSDTNYF
jgi:hypothetical protein